MYLTRVSEFVEFLSVKDHTLQEILAQLVLRTLEPIDATSAFISQLSNENTLTDVGSFGIGHQNRDDYLHTYDFRDKYPLTDSIRDSKIIWINTLPKWPEEYPSLKNLTYDTGERTFICVPIEKCGTPIAVLGIFCKSAVKPDKEIESFLNAICNLFAMHVYRTIDSSPEVQQYADKRLVENQSIEKSELTERQLLILRLMSERRTNINIGELLGYSESTIRQETIKIFSILNCHGREEASRIYGELFAEESKLAG